MPGRFSWLWTVLFVVAGLILFSVVTSNSQKQLTPAEYQACIAKENVEFVSRCYRETLAADMNKSRAELPVMPDPEDRLKECRANLGIARSIEKYYPDAQPCGKKPEISN